ncbi:MAG: glycosyltransferase [Phycisphaerales bacterium]|nr:glycosyltransferase [Phycisphaerales bacterium]
MKFSIVTPSFRNSGWLKLCIASVADQDIEHEHIIQDSCSDDGTQDWLPHDARVKAFIEKDRGMYDAVNRGFKRASGELLAYINCDEQYLPARLSKVAAFFDRRPEIDVVFADAMVIDAEGNYLCDRKAITPRKYHTMVGGSLSFLTCSTFIRRRVIHQRGLYFNADLRVLGDCNWALNLIESGVRMAILRETTTAFTDTGFNMGLMPNAHREGRDFFNSAPLWSRKMRPLITAHHRLRRLLSGAYATKRYEYSIFTKDSPNQRQMFKVTQPTFRWVRVPAGAAT